MVDTLGLLLMIKVVPADVREREGAKQLLTKVNKERHHIFKQPLNVEGSAIAFEFGSIIASVAI
jgi:hypothetical protein